MDKIKNKDIYSSKKYGDFEILNFEFKKEGHEYYKCKFIDTGYIGIFTDSNIIKGSVRDLFYPSYYNVGFIGKGVYNSSDKKCHSIWADMLRRCYDKKSLNYLNYGAKGVVVCEEWHNFQNFADWFYSQPLCYNYDIELDKDILSNIKNMEIKMYSPETCLIIPSEINKFFINYSIYCNIRNQTSGTFQVYYSVKNDVPIIKSFHNLLEAIKYRNKLKQNAYNDLLSKYKEIIPFYLYDILKSYNFNVFNNKKIIIFTGASGSGKSTLLSLLNEKYDIEHIEVSARKFLDKDKGSYDEQMCDELQSKIIYNNTLESIKHIFLNDNKIVGLSRGIVDCIAYSRVLKASTFLESLATEFLNTIKDKVIWIYLPVEFSLKDEDSKDIMRGMNEDIRRKTDIEIKNVLFENKVFYYEVSGTIENRLSQIEDILKINNIN